MNRNFEIIQQYILNMKLKSIIMLMSIGLLLAFAACTCQKPTDAKSDNDDSSTEKVTSHRVGS